MSSYYNLSLYAQRKTYSRQNYFITRPNAHNCGGGCIYAYLVRTSFENMSTNYHTNTFSFVNISTKRLDASFYLDTLYDCRCPVGWDRPSSSSCTEQRDWNRCCCCYRLPTSADRRVTCVHFDGSAVSDDDGVGENGSRAGDHITWFDYRSSVEWLSVSQLLSVH